MTSNIIAAAPGLGIAPSGTAALAQTATGAVIGGAIGHQMKKKAAKAAAKPT